MFTEKLRISVKKKVIVYYQLFHVIIILIIKFIYFGHIKQNITKYNLFTSFTDKKIFKFCINYLISYIFFYF